MSPYTHTQSTAGALLYELRLRSLPHMLDICASLDPPEWGGTQCVSLLDDVVGTYGHLTQPLAPILGAYTSFTGARANEPCWSSWTAAPLLRWRC